jgi:hypothetical protein
MHAMDTDAYDELRVLRARAYGPAADIEHDPAALKRLRELESVGEVTPTSLADASALPQHGRPPAQATPAPEPQPPAAPAAPEPQHSAADSGGTSVTTQEPRRLSRGIRVLWALSVVAAAALAASATYGLTKVSPVPASGGAPQVATLEPVSTIEIPAGWLGAGPSSAAWEFYGLTLFETAYGWTQSGTDCFTVVRTEDVPAEDADVTNLSFDGNIYSGCRVGAFPATVEFMVDSNSPRELRFKFPDSALQFVRDGDRIGVFVDAG